MTAGRHIPLDRTVAPDDPRPASHYQTLDRNDRATDYMAQGHCASRPSVEETRTTLIQAAHRYGLRISGMPQGDAWTRDDRTDRPRDDGPARFRVSRKAVGATVGGRASRAADGGAQGDEGPDVEGRTYELLPRFPRPPRAVRRGGTELWKRERRGSHNGRRPAS
jgi:hypothetical protein